MARDAARDEDRLRICHPKRLQGFVRGEQFVVDLAECEFHVERLDRLELLGGQALARTLPESVAEFPEASLLQSQPRRHLVATVPLEQSAAMRE